MNSTTISALAIIPSLTVSLFAYFVLSKSEKSYINVLTPYFLTAFPALYLLPLVYLKLFGPESSAYSHFWVYTAVAVEIVAFSYAYLRFRLTFIRLPGLLGYSNFGRAAIICLLAGIALYLPVLFEFRDFIFDPRVIYAQTRTGFGIESFISSTLSYVAVVLVLFSRRSIVFKTAVITLALALLIMHGSKAQVLSIPCILLLYSAYVLRKKVSFVRAAGLSLAMAGLGLLLFAATMSLGQGAAEILETVSQYSDYTRNAMLVVDSNYPRQYGRLTLESNVLAMIPRQLMPAKPKNFGSFALAEEFYPAWFDADSGSPAFGVGVQYADFGALAIVYLALMAGFKGWLARVFVNRLQRTNHPSDFFMLVFLADIPVFPVGIGWLLPEAIMVGFAIRVVSRLGTSATFHEIRA